jgi:putative PIN family toxin of toxin-antitoxin system
LRAVLDANILVSALLAPSGTPAQIVSRWLAGQFELVVSELLLAELERVLASTRLQRRVVADEAAAFLALLRRHAIAASDPALPAARSTDPDDDYVLALAEAEQAIVVSGDRHLLALADSLPVRTAREFLDELDRST